jgi:nitrogen fixation-related uncharacterized protein
MAFINHLKKSLPSSVSNNSLLPLNCLVLVSVFVFIGPLDKIYFKAGGNNNYDDDYDDVFPGDIIEQTDEIERSCSGLCVFCALCVLCVLCVLCIFFVLCVAKIYFKAGGNNNYDDDYDDVFPGDIIEQTDEIEQLIAFINHLKKSLPSSVSNNSLLPLNCLVLVSVFVFIGFLSSCSGLCVFCALCATQG